MSEPTKQSQDQYPAETAKKGKPTFILRLFVSGILENSIHAIKNINQICEQHLQGNYELEIIDIYRRPDLAISEQVIVIPVLIIKCPLPERRLIGDLSNTGKVLEILNIK